MNPQLAATCLTLFYSQFEGNPFSPEIREFIGEYEYMYMYLYIKKFSCYMIYCREKKIDCSNKGKKMWRAYCNVEMSFTSTQSAESVIAKVPIIRYLTLKLWKHRIRQIMKIAMAVHFCVTLFENRGKKLTYWSW